METEQALWGGLEATGWRANQLHWADVSVPAAWPGGASLHKLRRVPPGRKHSCADRHLEAEGVWTERRLERRSVWLGGAWEEVGEVGRRTGPGPGAETTVLAIYCCVTTLPRTQWHNQQTLTISGFLDEGPSVAQLSASASDAQEVGIAVSPEAGSAALRTWASSGVLAGFSLGGRHDFLSVCFSLVVLGHVGLSQ